MKAHCSVLIAVAIACAAPAANAAPAPDDGAACEAAYADVPHDAILDLLDPDAPADRRTTALATYERLATLTACPEFGYTLGQLYRHGPFLPGNPVPQDIERARDLIRPMAEAGYLPAFADLAEMGMRHADAREAMRWTQLYLHFVKRVQADYIGDADRAQFMRTAYNSHLLARTELVWSRLTRPVPPRSLVTQDLSAWLASYGDATTARMRDRFEGRRLRASAQDAVVTHVVSEPDDCYVNAPDGVGSASASWIVEVLPSGQAGRIVLESFVPNVDAARKMQGCVARYTYAPFDGDRPTTLRVSMLMGSRQARGLRR